jgi:peroxiredoxin
LPTNAQAPDFRLPGVDGKYYSLEDFDDAKVLVLIFTCNHCPTAQAYEDRIIQLVDDYENQGVRVVAISPNSVKTLLLEELGYSDLGDSYEEMKIRAIEKKYNFTYLYDGDTQETSIKYGPVATPHAFVFDSDRKLRYSGRLDDTEKPGTTNSNDLRSAIDAVLLGVEILEPVTKTFGCSVKWGWKKEWTEKVNEDWKKMPVSLNEINEAGVRILMKNDSDNLWLINVWATWCGPCTIEFPEFVKMHRMYAGRDFEFISLSADKIDRKEKALKFLEKQNAAVQNYIFAGTDIYKLIAAIDPQWNGALPYTVLIEPDGKIVYKQMGIIDPLELKRIIVNHPMIGRYY